MSTRAVVVEKAAQEIDNCMRAVEHAIAQQRLEGLTVSAATVEDLRRAARGEISHDEVIANIYARFPNAPLFRR